MDDRLPHSDLPFGTNPELKAALDDLLPGYYDELRGLARSCLAAERRDHTLQPTALVHEAYLRLIGQNRVDWNCRAQVLALAARVMRRILVNHARARNADKRGNGCCIELDRDLESLAEREIGVEPLDDALNRLTALDERQARIVEMRFFAGLSVEETAAALDISETTVKREWKSARLWLTRELENL